MSSYDYGYGQQDGRFWSNLRHQQDIGEWRDYASRLESQVRALQNQLAAAQGQARAAAGLIQEAENLRSELHELGARQMNITQERAQQAQELEDWKADWDWLASCLNDYREGIIP